MKRPRQEVRHLRERRLRVASEAARLMATEGLEDFHLAKLKAARQLGFDDEASLPRNVEVQEQLRQYQRLFDGGRQPAELRRRREAALQAMGFFAAFQPRLVGAVLDGTADAHSTVCLQVFSDDADAVARFMLDANMPEGVLGERRLRVDRERHGNFPAWRFSADGLAFEVTVLPAQLLRQAPLSEVDGKPMQRASSSALRELIGAG
jgi:hypothetical protein